MGDTAPSAIGIFSARVIPSGASTPRQSTNNDTPVVSIGTVGSYVKLMVHEILSLISPMLVHVVLGVARPATSRDRRTAAIFTAPVVDIVIFCVFFVPTVVFAQSTLSGVTVSVNFSSSGNVTTSVFSVRPRNNSVNNISTTTNAATSNNHWICFGVV